jgi:hypothetical protein
VNQCIAKANVLRCVGCFGFPFLALAAYAYKVSSVGDDLHSYWSRVTTIGIPLASALLVLGGCIAWATITWPKASLAFRHRGCAISLDEGLLNFYDEKIARGDIASVGRVRRPFDVQLYVQSKDGSTIAQSIVLLNPTPELIVQRLKDAGL